MPQKNSTTVVILGNSGVGKTQFLSRLPNSLITSPPAPTIGVDVGFFNMNGPKISLWEICGLKRFHFVARPYLEKATAVILMFDNSNLQSFNDLEEWIVLAKRHAPQGLQFYLFANTRNDGAKKVPTEIIKQLIKRRCIIDLTKLDASSTQSVYRAITNFYCKIFIPKTPAVKSNYFSRHHQSSPGTSNAKGGEIEMQVYP